MREDVSSRYRSRYPIFPVFSIHDTLCIDDNTTTITPLDFGLTWIYMCFMNKDGG